MSLNGFENLSSLEKWLDKSIKHYVSKLDVKQHRGLHDLIIGAVEEPLVQMVLDKTNGNQTQAANILGLNRNTLRKKIKTYRIKCKESP